MLHIIGQMRNMFMAGVMNTLEAAAPAAKENTFEMGTENLPEDKEAVNGVTKEDLKNLVAAKQILDAGKNIEKGASKQAITDVQEMLAYLDYNIGDFGPNKNGVDGDYGATMTQGVKDFQLDAGLPQTGVVDKATYDALLTQVNAQAGVSAEAATTGVESKSAVKVESVLNDYSGKKIADMDDFEQKALQRDINSLLEQKGEKLITVDGKVRSGTKGAMEGLGFDENSLTALRDAAQKARNEQSLEASNKSIESFPSEKTEIESILNGIFKNATTDAGREVVISSLAALTDIKDIDGDGKEDWNEEQKERRLVVAQYITDRLASMVDAGEVSAMRASQVIEGLLAQEKFESKPGREAIARMLGTIPELIASTKDESGQEITARIDKKSALSAITNSKEPMDMGVSLERGYFQVAGQKYDIDRAEDMFIVTGNGNQRVGIRETGALHLTNVAIVGNVLVGLMGNGCEGNVVYIPLDTKPQAPKKAVPKKTTPVEKPVEPTPETPTRIQKNKWCNSTTNTYWIQWGYEGIPGGESEDTGEKCDGGGGGGGDKGVGSETDGGDVVTPDDNGNVDPEVGEE